MSTRDRLLAGLLSILLIAFSGAVLAPAFEPVAGEPTPGPTAATARAYVEGVLGRATSASPFGARTAADRGLVALLFRGLVRLGPDGAIVADLADRWSVDPTGAEWTFHLRDDLRWQDGEPITSEDVAFTLGALTDPSYTGPGASSWTEVQAVADGPSTIRISLATPLGGFLVAATQPIAPAHLLGGTTPADLPDHPFGRRPVGSGPFRLVLLDDAHAVLAPWVPVEEGGAPISGEGPPRATDSLGEPSPTARGDSPLPYLPGIEFRFFDEAEALMAAWTTGALDAASGLAPAEARELAAAQDVRLLRYPGTTLIEVVLNLRPTLKTFADPAVRRALLGAIDRDGIIADVLLGTAERADALIPPSSWAFDAAASPPLPADPEAARAALAAAGWTEGDGGWIPKGAETPLTIELLVAEATANPVLHEVALAVADAWRSVGLRVTLVEVPAGELVGARLRSGEFTAAVVGVAIGLDPDLYPLLASTQAVAGGSNVAGLQDPALDRLLVAARAPGDQASRLAAYVALQTALATGTYALPIAFRDELIVLRDTVSGPSIRPLGTSGDRFWDVLTWRLADGR